MRAPIANRNALKARLAAGGALTHEQPIRVFDDTTFHGLVSEILRTLLGIRATQLEAGVAGFSVGTSVSTVAPQGTRRPLLQTRCSVPWPI